MAATDIFVRIKGVDKISGMLKGIKGRVGGLGKALRVAGVVGAAALVGVGIAALKFGNDFKDAENVIRTGTGATGEALGALYEDFKAAFAEVPGDMKVVAQTTADLNTALGLTGKPLQNLTKQVVELGRVTETDVAAILPKVTRLFGDWSVATEDQEAALDNVFKASQATGAPVERLSDLLVKYGAPLRQFNYGMEEGAAMLGKWEKEGVNTELVMGGLRKSMSKFAREGTPLREGLDETIKKIQELGPGAESTAMAMDTFGVISGPDMAAAILEGKFAIDDLVGTIGESDDSIMKVAEDTMTWQDKLKRLRNKVLVKLEPTLTKFVDFLGVAADYLGESLPGAIDEVEGFIKSVQPYVEALWGSFKSGIEVIAPLVKDFVEFIMSKKPLLIVAIAAIGAAIVLAFGPVALAAVAIVGLIALIGLLKDNWTEIEEVFTEVVDDIIDTVENIPVIGEIFKGTMKTIKIVVTTVFKLIKNRIETAIKVVRAIIKTVTALIRGDWSAAWQGIKDLVGALWGGIKTEIKLVLGAIKDLIWNQLTTIAGIFDDVFGGITRDVISEVVNLKNKITDTFNKTISWVKRRWPLLLAILTGPFGLAVYAIIKKKDAIIGVVRSLRNWLFGAFGHIRDTIGNIMTGLKDRVVGAFRGAKDTVKGIVDGIKDIVIGRFNNLLYNLTHLPGKFVSVGLKIGKAIVNGIINGLNFLIRRWNDFKIPSVGWGPFKTPAINTPNLPLIRSLDKGALDVAGDTLARLHKGEMVIPRAFADSLRSALTTARSPVAAGGGSFNFYGDINLSGRATREDARDLVDMVETEWRSRRRRGR